MGIRYYGWPLRNELDYYAAIQDPCAASRAIDRREKEENLLDLDKSYRDLYNYFIGIYVPNEHHTRVQSVLVLGDADGPTASDNRCGCLKGATLALPPRPGALLLEGEVAYSADSLGHYPFFGVISPEYVQLAALDYATVDPNELEEVCITNSRFGPDSGDYCRELFLRFRDGIQRFADEGAGLLYTIQ